MSNSQSKSIAAPNNYLYTLDGIPSGILRVECKKCEVEYTINGKVLHLLINNGSQDRFIQVNNKTYLKTTIIPKESQLIRLLVFNANGKTVVNSLDSFKNGISVRKEVLMTFLREPNAILIKKYSKK